MYADPYQQNTRCAIANDPLLSFLYPDRARLEPPRGRSLTGNKAPVSPLRHRHSTFLDPLHLGVRALHEPDSKGVVPTPVGLPVTAEKGSDVVGVEKDEKSLETEDTGEVQRPSHSNASNPPFKSALKEVRRRIKEQLEVHKALNAAGREIDLFSEEVRIFRATHDTAAFMSHLNQQGLAAIENAYIQQAASTNKPNQHLETAALQPENPNTTASHELQKSDGSMKSKVQSPTNPFLAEVLQSFSRDSQKNRDSVSATITEKQRKQRQREVLDAAFRPEPPPVPYRRVVFVPLLEDPGKKSSMKSPSKSNHRKKSSTFRSKGHTGSALASSTGPQYEDDFSSALSTVHTAESVEDSGDRISAVTWTAASNVDEPSASSSLNGRTTITADVPSEISTHADITSVSPASSLERVKSSLSKNSVSSDSLQSVLESVIASEEHDEEKPTGSVVHTKKMERGALVEVLKQFFASCQQANRLALQLSSDAPHSNSKPEPPIQVHSKASPSPSQPSSRSSFSSSVPSSSPLSNVTDQRKAFKDSHGDTAADDWVNSMALDVKDLKKLRHFAERLQEHLKAMDVQRKVRATKKKLLAKAQKLSQVRQKMRADPKLSLKKAAGSDVEDLLADFRDSLNVSTLNGDDIADEVEFALDGDSSPNSNEESIAEDFSFENDGGSETNAEIDDEVEDLVDDLDRSRSAMGDEIEDEVMLDIALDDVEEMGSSVILDEVENHFAEKLADASTLSNVMDEVDLPYGDDMIIGTVEDLVADEISDEVDGSVAEEGIPDHGSLPSASVLSFKSSRDASASSDHLSDADESVLPKSSLGSWSSDERTSTASSSHHSLENDMFWTKDRRLKALKRTSAPPTFDQLYNPMVETESSSASSTSSESNSTTSNASSNLPSELMKTNELRSMEPLTDEIAVGLDAATKVQPETGSNMPENNSLNDVTLESGRQCDPVWRDALKNDFIALESWKAQQKRWIRNIGQLSLTDKVKGATAQPYSTNTEVEEDSSSLMDLSTQHWGMLEAMLLCRFPVRLENPITCRVVDEQAEEKTDYSSSDHSYFYNTQTK